MCQEFGNEHTVNSDDIQLHKQVHCFYPSKNLPELTFLISWLLAWLKLNILLLAAFDMHLTIVSIHGIFMVTAGDQQ